MDQSESLRVSLIGFLTRWVALHQMGRILGPVQFVRRWLNTALGNTSASDFLLNLLGRFLSNRWLLIESRPNIHGRYAACLPQARSVR